MPIAGGILFPNEAHGDPLELMRAIGSAAEAAGTTMVSHAAGMQPAVWALGQYSRPRGATSEAGWS
jgi:glycine/D-amino acid oxidase-like deaminating enzyme